MQCKTENVGQYGQKSLLECVINTAQEIGKAEIRVVTWKKDENPLLVFVDGQTKSEGPYSFAEPSWNSNNMNVSLLITNTAVDNEGVYTCMVITDSGDGFSDTSFKVTGESPQPWLTTETFHSQEMMSKSNPYLLISKLNHYLMKPSFCLLKYL